MRSPAPSLGALAWRKVSFLLGGLAVAMAASGQVPSGPDRPASGDECIAAFAPHFTAHFRWRSTHCRPCDALAFKGRNWEARYSACYDKCGEEANSDFATLQRARNACCERAKRVSAENEKLLAEGMNLGRKMQEKFLSAYSVVTSPETFVREKLDRSDALYGGIFRKGSAAEKKTLGREAFHYSLVMANAGIDAAEEFRGRSTIIGGIQKAALARIAAVYENAIDELEASLGLIDSWNSEQSRHYLTTGRAFSPDMLSRFRQRLVGLAPPRPEPERSGQKADCAVLDDPPRSNALLQQDQARWLELVGTCRR